MDKLDLLKFIQASQRSFIQASGKVKLSKDEKYRRFLNKNNIVLPIPLITEQSLYDYFLDEVGKYCVCGSQSNFIALNHGYSTFCSKKCLHSWRSNKMLGENNAYTRASTEAKLELARKISEKIRLRIKEGTFTPCVTNSWARSKCDVVILRDNTDITVKCRSSWDAYFQIHNPQLLYEKLRVQYFYKHKFHSYLIDFVDVQNKKMFEIKPSALINTTVNKLKFQAATNWAKSNQYEFIIIDNTWFKENYDESKLKNQPDSARLMRLLKQFKKK